jgi:hypothetical protein
VREDVELNAVVNALFSMPTFGGIDWFSWKTPHAQDVLIEEGVPKMNRKDRSRVLRFG